MTNLKLSVDAQRQVALDIAQLADDVCDGRWLATGGGDITSPRWCRERGHI